jgi:sulfotransferase family protein
MISKKPILITGSHRSGTTWVGKILSASPSVAHIYEPFNVTFPPSIGMCSVRFDHWFTYVTEENESIFYKPVKNMLDFQYNLFGALKTVRSIRQAKKILNEFKCFYAYRGRKIIPLVKDPIAVFSAEWLASRFNMKIIILLRHPAAFASSLKRKNWNPPFLDLIEQPLLMRDHLHPFESEIKEHISKEYDIIDQASLLWKLIYYVVKKYQRKHSDWIFLRHEDLSRNPLNCYSNLFYRLNLNFSENIRRLVEEYSSSNNLSELPTDSNATHMLKRNSRVNIWNWKSRLVESEIKRIRNSVEEVSNEFYSDTDW